MINWTLYKREMKGSIKLLVIFGAIITMYVSIIVSMYDPEMMATLDSFVEVMPEMMAAVGMSAGATSLLGFMISYLYGFILLIFPMVFCILRGNGLIAKYVDRGSMVALVAAPVKRRTVAFTQMKVLGIGIFLLIAYVTVLELIIAQISFPGELVLSELLTLNAGLLCLHLFIGQYLLLCLLPVLGYEIQRRLRRRHPGTDVCAANAGKCWRKGGNGKIFHPVHPVRPQRDRGRGNKRHDCMGVLLGGALVLYAAGILVFSKKDLHI